MIINILKNKKEFNIDQIVRNCKLMKCIKKDRLISKKKYKSNIWIKKIIYDGKIQD